MVVKNKVSSNSVSPIKKTRAYYQKKTNNKIVHMNTTPKRVVDTSFEKSTPKNTHQTGKNKTNNRTLKLKCTPKKGEDRDFTHKNTKHFDNSDNIKTLAIESEQTKNEICQLKESLEKSKSQIKQLENKYRWLNDILWRKVN